MSPYCLCGDTQWFLIMILSPVSCIDPPSSYGPPGIFIAQMTRTVLSPYWRYRVSTSDAMQSGIAFGCRYVSVDWGSRHAILAYLYCRDQKSCFSHSVHDLYCYRLSSVPLQIRLFFVLISVSYTHLNI